MAQFYSAKRRVTTRQIITVTVNDLDPFGQGVARHDGKALFISGLLPGECAEVTLTQDKRNFGHATVKKRLTDSPARVTPRCPHFGVCGGCQQQHASVALQQSSKAQSLARLMNRPVDDIIACAVKLELFVTCANLRDGISESGILRPGGYPAMPGYGAPA